MNGILNEATNTVHRHSAGEQGLQTDCGLTHSVPESHLCQVVVDEHTGAGEKSKCGRCFEDGGGY